jgi:hypothetical protein
MLIDDQKSQFGSRALIWMLCGVRTEERNDDEGEEREDDDGDDEDDASGIDKDDVTRAHVFVYWCWGREGEIAYKMAVGCWVREDEVLLELSLVASSRLISRDAHAHGEDTHTKHRSDGARMKIVARRRRVRAWYSAVKRDFLLSFMYARNRSILVLMSTRASSSISTFSSRSGNFTVPLHWSAYHHRLQQAHARCREARRSRTKEAQQVLRAVDVGHEGVLVLASELVVLRSLGSVEQHTAEGLVKVASDPFHHLVPRLLWLITDARKREKERKDEEAINNEHQARSSITDTNKRERERDD